MKKKNKILLFTHNFPSTSFERKDAGTFLYDFCISLSRKANIEIVTPFFPGNKEKYKNFSVNWFPWSGDGKKLGDWKITSPFSIIRFFVLLYQGSVYSINHVKLLKPDVILAAWAVPSGIFAYISFIFTGHKYSIWCLGSDLNKYVRYPIIRQLMYLSLMNAQNVFVNSYSLDDKVKKFVGRNAIFLPAITNLDSKNIKSNKKSGKVKFLFLGRLEKVKGVDILLNACVLLNQKKYKLFIGGDGNMESDLKKFILKNGLQNSVEMLGRLNEKEISKYMSICDYLIIPSRNESLPLVMIEASRFKLPIIASDVGDCKRIIDKYNVGFSFERGNIFALSKIMNNVILNKYKFGNFKKFSSDFDQKRAIEIYLKTI